MVSAKNKQKYAFNLSNIKYIEFKNDFSWF